MRRRGYVWLGLLTGCGLLEVGPASEITAIEPVSVRVEVLELGPLNPERVTFPSDSLIAEAMPGDRVRVTIEVVDTDGLALADERLDSLWVQYGAYASVELGAPEFEQRCDQLETWTTWSLCELGEGRGSIEFEVPPLDETSEFVSSGLLLFAVIAWDGQSARECWEARREGQPVPTDCDYLWIEVSLGPWWWLMRYGAELGISPYYPVEQLPAPVFLQQANRAPKVEQVLIERDDEVLSLAPVEGAVGPVDVEPGEHLRLSYEVDENLQISQAKFGPITSAGDLFSLFPELLGARVATAGPIRVEQPNSIPSDTPIIVSVDEDAPPGLARLVLVVHDPGSGAEQVVRVEFELR